MSHSIDIGKRGLEYKSDTILFSILESLNLGDFLSPNNMTSRSAIKRSDHGDQITE